MRYVLLLYFFSLLPTFTIAQTVTLDSTILTYTTVASNLDIPWEIKWGPDDKIWLTERYGRFSRINPVDGTQEILLDLSGPVYQQSESGLLGFAFHPDFNNTPEIFLVYTYNSGGIKERLVKYTVSNGALISPVTLLENIPGNTTHIGSRILFLPDGTLLFTTGDAQNQSASQSTSTLTGKVLRLNKDGTIPADNPIPGNPMYTYGHRNAQGLWLGPNGILYSSEHGPTTDDELNIIVKGANYGWPNVHGLCDTPNEITFCNSNTVVEPIAHWTPTIAPSDILYYEHDAIPEFQNKLLMTVLKSKQLIAFEFDATGQTVVSETKWFTNQFKRLRDICVDPEGSIYLATSGSSWSNTNPFSHTIVKLQNLNYVNSKHVVLNSESIGFSPNPISSGSYFRIDLKENIKGSFSIHDISGKMVLKVPIEKSQQIQIELDKGIYNATFVSDKNQVYSEKLIVN